MQDWLKKKQNKKRTLEITTLTVIFRHYHSEFKMAGVGRIIEQEATFRDDSLVFLKFHQSSLGEHRCMLTDDEADTAGL